MTDYKEGLNNIQDELLDMLNDQNVSPETLLDIMTRFADLIQLVSNELNDNMADGENISDIPEHIMENTLLAVHIKNIAEIVREKFGE